MDARAYTAVIPAFNAEATIGEAIRSILDQTPPPASVIVVDDGSGDATAELAGRFGDPVRVIRQANTGPGGATTHGLRQVTTPFAATLDSDDLWLPGKAGRQLDALSASPEASAVFGHVRLFAADPADPRNGRVAPGWTRTTLMMRTGLFERVGAMEDMPGNLGELIDWVGRARDAGETLLMIDDVLALRRIRRGSLSDGRDATRDRGYIHAARRAIERRRTGPPRT